MAHAMVRACAALGALLCGLASAEPGAEFLSSPGGARCVADGQPCEEGVDCCGVCAYIGASTWQCQACTPEGEECIPMGNRCCDGGNRQKDTPLEHPAHACQATDEISERYGITKYTCQATGGRAERAGSSVRAVGAASLCVRSLLPEPLVLVSSCEENQTVGAGGEIALNLSGGQDLWLVPRGAAWTCKEGCPDCFRISSGASPAGDLAVTVGLGLAANETDVQVAVSEETSEGDDPETDGLHDTIHEYVRDSSGELSVTSVKLYLPLARNSTENSTAPQQGCTGVVIEGPTTFSTGVTLLSQWGWGPRRRHRRRYCRNICRWMTWGPGPRRRRCKRSCRWGF